MMKKLNIFLLFLTFFLLSVIFVQSVSAYDCIRQTTSLGNNCFLVEFKTDVPNASRFNLRFNSGTVTSHVGIIPDQTYNKHSIYIESSPYSHEGGLFDVVDMSGGFKYLAFKFCKDTSTVDWNAYQAMDGNINAGYPSATCTEGSFEAPQLAVLGCTDPSAQNYDEDATEDDDSCTYLTPEEYEQVLAQEYETDWMYFDWVNTNPALDMYNDTAIDGQTMTFPLYSQSRSLYFVYESGYNVPENAEIIGFTFSEKWDWGTQTVPTTGFNRAVISVPRWNTIEGQSEYTETTNFLGTHNWFPTFSYRPDGSYDSELEGYFRLLFVPTEHALTHDGLLIFMVAHPEVMYRPKLDMLRFKVHYKTHIPQVDASVTMLNPRENATAGTLTVNLSGDVGYTSETSYCDISFFHTVSGSNIASGTSESAVATVRVEAMNPRADTLFEGGKYYGYGYSPMSSEWYADDVVFPFTDGVLNTYPMSFTCYEDTWEFTGWSTVKTGTDIVAQGQGVSSSSPDFDPTLVATSSATLTDIDSCAPTDIFCKLRVWLSSFFKSLFIGDISITQTKIETTKNKLKERVPFAYVYEVFSLNLSSPAEFSTAPPELTVPIKIGATTTDFDFSFSNESSTALYAFRDFMFVFIWASFFVYVFSYGKRILT